MMIGRLWMPSQDPAARRMAHSVHSYKRDDYGWTYVDLRNTASNRIKPRI